MAEDGSKAAAAYLIDPLNAPQPAEETGPGTHFGSTFDPAHKANAPALPKTSTGGSSSSNNSYRKSIDKHGTPEKTGASSHTRAVSGASNGGRRRSPREEFPNYRAEAFGDFEPAPRSRSGSHGKPPPSYEHATGSAPGSPKGHRRRTSSLNQRYPGDESTEPLERIRRDSLRAHRSPHLRKKHQPGADTIDRLDPAIGGRAYHHEGPYDAALLARNTSYKSSPVAALQNSNEEALKATPQENVKDSLDRHKPLDGVAVVPPGMSDRFGRTYNYEEGADLMHEDNPDGPGYKRWGGEEYSPDDLKGKGEPSFSLDKAYKAHTINDNGIEMANGDQLYKNRKQRGSLDNRDPVDIAGGEGHYVDAEIAHTNDTDSGMRRKGSLRDGLKKRIGSLRKKRADS
ncbi:hypothetical protein HII31_01911 [Pseudocercospora fuligena]|uniref:Pal1 cell morphology protein n=1 Tax=Pseudocercospora fuligena TaxID=685502 RepID=A0A8H6RT04_9PEZI|nr:hypothetical protein HII31_01911 [Pseudocercospora fuligena]